MKKIIPFTISLVLVSGIIHAQSTETESASETAENNTNSTFISRSAIIPISEMDQRKVYQWENGQRATPTGRQAGDPSAVYARVYGDSAVVLKPHEVTTYMAARSRMNSDQTL